MIITIKCTKEEKEAFIDMLDDTSFCPFTCPFTDKDLDTCNVPGDESCGNCARIVYEVTDDE